MNIKLKFDCYSRNVYIPDGYVTELSTLKTSFLDWMKQQPECIVELSKKQIGYSYNERNFVKYVNDVILKDSKEKAYFVSPSEKNRCKCAELTF